MVEPSKSEMEMFGLEEEGGIAMCLWEDEEIQRFYTEFPNLKDYLPNYKVVKSEKGSSTQVSLTNLTSLQ